MPKKPRKAVIQEPTKAVSQEPTKAGTQEPTKALYIYKQKPSKAFFQNKITHCAFQAWGKNIHTKKILNSACQHVLHILRGKHVGLKFWLKHCCPNVFSHGFQSQDVCFPMSVFALSRGLAQLANYI